MRFDELAGDLRLAESDIVFFSGHRFGVQDQSFTVKRRAVNGESQAPCALVRVDGGDNTARAGVGQDTDTAITHTESRMSRRCGACK